MLSPRRYPSIALLCLLILGFGSVAAALDSFDALRARYARVRSVHLVSTASVTRREAADSGKLLSGSMRFEYWASASGYRMRCASDPELKLVSDMELANDGSQWQLLQIAKRELVLSGITTRPNPLTCPNPLFMLIEFLGHNGPGCESCGVSLNDLWDAAARDRGGMIATRRGLPHGVEEYVITTGGSRGTAGQFLLTVGRSEGQPVPTSLVRFYASGRKAAEFGVSDFSPSEVGPLPTRITGRSFEDSDGSRLIDTVSYSVDSLQINRRLDERVFTIDWSSADMVFDADASQYLIHPNISEVNEKLQSWKTRVRPPKAQPD